MYDWNHNGKQDSFDQMMDYHVFEETNKAPQNTNYYYRKKSGPGPTICFFIGLIFIEIFFPIALFLIWVSVMWNAFRS